jgi:hypothetical protein
MYKMKFSAKGTQLMAFRDMFAVRTKITVDSYVKE